MDQNQQPRPWWRHSELVWVIVLLALIGLVIAIILGYLLNWEWTGLVGITEKPATRTAWDWLELLIVPLVLALAALWFNNETRRSEQAIAQDRVQEEALQRYLDRMQELILDKRLRGSEKDAEIRNVVRTRTLTVLRSLDGNRKGEVVRFLYEADLITGKVVREDSGQTQSIDVIIGLGGAHLRYANLDGAYLRGAYLMGTYLEGASLWSSTLVDAHLDGAYLRYANLTRAHLAGASLRNANLESANLTTYTANVVYTANLEGADLRNANLTRANLRSTDLRNTSLEDTILEFANQRGANLRSADLRNTSLEGTILEFADLGDANLQGVNLRNANLARCQSQGCQGVE